MSVDPITLLTAASTLLSAGGSVLAGVQANQMGQYQAKVAKMNAQIAEDNARRAIERSQVEAQESDMTALAFLGAQEAMQGASGLQLGGGSQIMARKAAKELGRLDALRIRQGGELEAYGFRTDAANFQTQAAMARAEGRNSLISSFFDAGSSLLTGAVRTRRSFNTGGRSFGSLVS